jgi:hypothetical protein
MRTIGIILVIVGLIGTIWGGVTYVKDRDTAHLGPIHLTTEKKGHISIPPMAGVATLVVGGLFVFMSTRRGLRMVT